MNSEHHQQNKSLSLILATACGAASLIARTVGLSSAYASESLVTQTSAPNHQIIANAQTCPRYAGGGLLSAY